MATSIENMTDEEIMNMETPPVDDTPVIEEPVSEEVTPEAEVEITPEEEAQPEPTAEAELEVETIKPEKEEEVVDTTDEKSEEEPGEELVKEEETAEENPLEASDDEVKAPEAKKEEPKAEEKVEDKPKVEGDEPKKEEEPVTPVSEEIDYKAGYEKLMAPFKANGKEINIDNPDDLRRLVQMGANYTQKLQALQPNLKMVKMLENNGLLDEGKLSYLIDLDKKDPNAIQKLLRDSGIDPMDIDTSVESDYKPGNHSVSDGEMAFQSTLETVASTESGQQLLVDINNTWDDASKDELFKEPGALTLLQQQKESGVYDIIVNEVEKLRMLGDLQGVSSVRAYQAVGNVLEQQGKLMPQQEVVTPDTDPAPISEQPETAKEQPARVVESRPAPRKVIDNNDEKAKAAAPVKSAPKKVKQDINPLNMSDEDFENAAVLNGKI